MKYKDRHTLNSWNKQVDKLDEADSQRKRRRKLEREMINFTSDLHTCIIMYIGIDDVRDIKIDTVLDNK